MGALAKRGPLHLLSTERMPAAPKPEPQALCQWHGPDNEKRYRKQPHPSLKPGDVEYRFNSLGYRCPEFGSAGDALGVAVLGASEILGTGVPQEQTLTAVFARRLAERLGRPTVGWNLGIGGSGPDYIARMLVSVLPVLKPAVVLMVFPFPGRREHIDDEGKVTFFNNGRAGQRRLAERLLEPDKHALMQASMTLSSDYNDAINLFKNYQACEALCEKHGAMWLYSATRDVFLDEVAHLLDPAHRVQPGLSDLKTLFDDDAIGLARDMLHPGIGPHAKMADLFMAQLERCHADRLAALQHDGVPA